MSDKIKLRLNTEVREFVNTHTNAIINKISSRTIEHLNEFRKDYPGIEGGKYIQKMRSYVEEKLAFYYYMDIPDDKSITCLDIGTGSGYLPFIMEHFGHECVAMDLDTSPVFNETVKMLGVNRISHRVEAFQPIPKMKHKFDYIVGTRVCFNNHMRENHWKEEEWRFFINDIQQYLKKDGNIRFFLNRDKVYWSFHRNPFLLEHKNDSTEIYNTFAGPCVDFTKKTRC